MPQRRPSNNASISVCRKPGSHRSELAPKRRNALHLAPVFAELLFGIEIFPSTAVLELANVGKPPLRQRMPFLGNLIETDSALHSSH